MYRCPECDYGYVETSASDRRRHRKIHDKIMFGPAIAGLANCVNIHRDGQRSVAVINSDSTLAQRRIAQDVSLIAAGDTEFSFVAYHAKERRDERNIHLFVGVEGTRAKSYMAFELRPNVWKCTWNEYDAGICHELPDKAPMWSIGYLWVCRADRRRGWIRRTIAGACDYLHIPSGEYGWHTPFSEDGLATARRICPTGIYIAK